MRLGVICKQDTANGHYRAVLPLAELERRGHRVAWPGRYAYDRLLAGTPDLDLLHIHQFVGGDNLDVVMRLRHAGVAVVWDSDDDALGVPRGSETYRRLGGRRKLRRIFDQTVEMARTAHLMTTTSEQLADVYREAGVEHVVAIGNYLAPTVLDGRRRRRAGIVVGLVAADEHVADLDGLKMGKVLQAVLDANADVRVASLGVDLKLRDPRYLNNRRVPFAQLLDHVRDFDVGLAPLVDSRFSRARSDVKLKEYAACGVAWLASPIGPYVGMGERQGGLLVDDGDWYDAITALVDDVRRRNALAQRGREWATTQTIRHAGAAWEAAFRGAIARARREAGRGAGSSR